MQHLKLRITLPLTVVIIATYCGINVSLASAAGFDNPYQNSVTNINAAGSHSSASCQAGTVSNEASPSDVSDASTPSQRSTCPLTLEWQRWGLPYVQEDTHCRELSGNLVCVTPESATRLHW